MSSLSRDEVAKLAALARIEMTEDELVGLASQFGSILDAVARASSTRQTPAACWRWAWRRR